MGKRLGQTNGVRDHAGLVPVPRDTDAPQERATPDDNGEATSARLRALLLGPEGNEPLLSELASWAAGQVEDAVSCGITVSTVTGMPRIGATSDQLAKRMDAIQYVLDDGPCLTCIREQTVVRIGNVRSDRRWLEFAVRGQREGVASSLSVPMIVATRVVGAVNLYSRVCDGLDGGRLDRAQQVAHQAGGAIGLAMRLAERENATGLPETSPGPGSIIDQAVGIIMARQQISAAAAFDILRTQSYHARTEVRERAGAVVAEVIAAPR